MKPKIHLLRLLAVWALVVCAACQSGSPALRALPGGAATISPTPTLALSGSFTPYQTMTPTRLATRPSTTPPTWTPLPTITPTPRTYTVKAGDDMGGIALRYRVPLADLKTANPSVNPRLMKIGTVLIIPGVAPVVAGAAPVTATPQPVRVSSAACTPDAKGGVWCFALVQNQSGAPAIGVAAQFTLVDASGKQAGQQTVSLPLDLLQPQTSQPLAVYFPSPAPSEYQVEVQLTSALPASAAAERYPAVQVVDAKITLLDGGQSAQASGSVQLNDGQADPAQLALLAVAFAGDGSVVGLRRWDSPQPPHAGQPVSFQIQVYSVAGPITRVTVLAEARK